MLPPNQYPTIKVGGLFNQPNYLRAYHEATRLLMQAGREDVLAMPIIYLQRHTVELLLKELRDGALAVITATQEIQAAKGQPILDFKQKNAKDLKIHHLGDLLVDVEAALSALDWKVPIPGLHELVALCESVEHGDESRWRYASGKSGQSSFSRSVHGDLEELPIHEIQHRLNQIAEEEQVGMRYEEVVKADTISSYRWSLILTNHQLDQERYALDLL